MVWEEDKHPQASPPPSAEYLNAQNDESPSVNRILRIKGHVSQPRLHRSQRHTTFVGAADTILEQAQDTSSTDSTDSEPRQKVSSRTTGFSPSPAGTGGTGPISRHNSPRTRDLIPTPRRLLWQRSSLRSSRSDDEGARRPPSDYTELDRSRSEGSGVPLGCDNIVIPDVLARTKSGFDTLGAPVGFGLATSPVHKPNIRADLRLHNPEGGYWKDIDIDGVNAAYRRLRIHGNPQTPNHSRPYSFTRRSSDGNEHYPEIPDPEDPARKLSPWQLRCQIFLFYVFVLCVNGACLAAALANRRHLWVLILIVYIKSKDLLSTIIQIFCLSFQAIYALFHKPKDVPPKWILSLITAYSEAEEQVLKTLTSVRIHSVSPHKQVICLILDGKPKKITEHLKVIKTFRRPYVTSKFARCELKITAGFVVDTPLIIIEKTENAGKKDSLVLCHDLFNALRDNAPLYTKLLREELSKDVLPLLTKEPGFNGFDLIFATDADSIMHEGAIASLADALGRDKNAIAACGLVLAEMKPGAEWSSWYLYQQFEYTFGQYVRRRAEGIWGKVTCLPGCITMIVVRSEMAGAIRRYTEPVKEFMVLRHQVQYLGTDRRLTYCMLAQDKKLRTLFVPHAVSETVAPQTLRHYLSQRRRWASNAYFNNYFYCFGTNQIWITRFWASIELVRLTLVYYRVANTALFIHGLVRNFAIIKLVPFIIVTQTPTCWYLLFVMFHEPILRWRAHKLFFGFAINKIVSSVLSIIIFTTVVFNLGNQAWGRTGISTKRVIPLSPMTFRHSWTPTSLGRLVRDTVRSRLRANKTSTKRKAVDGKAVRESAATTVVEDVPERLDTRPTSTANNNRQAFVAEDTVASNRETLVAEGGQDTEKTDEKAKVEKSNDNEEKVEEGTNLEDTTNNTEETLEGVEKETNVDGKEKTEAEDMEERVPDTETDETIKESERPASHSSSGSVTLSKGEDERARKEGSNEKK